MSNLKKHAETLKDELSKIQETCCNTANIPAKELCNLQERFIRVQNALIFIESLEEALSRIIKPNNGMKVI